MRTLVVGRKRASITLPAVMSLVLILIVATLAPAAAFAKGPPSGGGGGGGGGGETAVGNNLSFPAIAVDQFAIAPLAAPSLSVPYAGDYPGLAADEIAALLANGPWYAQQTTGNVWQAQYAAQAAEDVSYVDWGDNIESVNPKVRAPFRLEVTLYKQLVAPMTAYTMAVLEYPSSADELQGTNGTMYASSWATVVSASPKLVIQYFGASVPTTLTWLGTQWDAGTPVPVSFAPELNVGGKYVFGASEGGWKPTQAGYYRITFYVPSGGVNLALAQIGNYADFSTGTPPAGEGTAATPALLPDLNLTYVDVLAVGSGGGGRR